MIIKKTINDYHALKISKPDFINSMYDCHHSKLFDYSDYLKNTNVKKIEIIDDKVILTTRDHGIKMICPKGDRRTALLETLNFYEYEKDDTEMITNLVGDGDCFFDVGANIGWHTILVGALKRSVSIHSFEPIKSTYSFLDENIKLNAIQNVSLYDFGFSNKKGEFDFYYYPGGSVNASAANLTNRDDVEILKCQLLMMDEFINEKSLIVDFIKCDVEGGELLVFKGGENAIKKHLPIVFSEILRKWSAKFNYKPNDIFNFFYDLGYKSFYTENNRLIEFGFMNDDTIQTNFFFLHSEKHSQQIRRYA